MLDRIDRKILARLQTDSRPSIAELSGAVGLSPSACHRRISILEEKGIIERYSASLNGEAMGYQLLFIVEVSLRGQSTDFLQEFENSVLNCRAIIECHLMTGQSDYILKIAARDRGHYEKLYREVIAPLPHVSRLQSSLVMKTVKRWAGYPTDGD